MATPVSGGARRWRRGRGGRCASAALRRRRCHRRRPGPTAIAVSTVTTPRIAALVIVRAVVPETVAGDPLVPAVHADREGCEGCDASTQQTAEQHRSTSDQQWHRPVPPPAPGCGRWSAIGLCRHRVWHGLGRRCGLLRWLRCALRCGRIFCRVAHGDSSVWHWTDAFGAAPVRGHLQPACFRSLRTVGRTG